MSLEIKIEALTAAVRDLIGVLNNQKQEVAPIAPSPVPTITTVAPVAPVAAAPVMPPPPSFVTTPVVTAGAPFNDPKGLIDYVMGAYKALGPQKGAQIQTVLTGLGYGNINDIKPEHYLALYSGIEALKG